MEKYMASVSIRIEKIYEADSQEDADRMLKKYIDELKLFEVMKKHEEENRIE